MPDIKPEPGSLEATPRLKRIARHFTTDHRSARRAFPPEAMARIEAATASGERAHAGQVRFVVESALPLGLVVDRHSAHDRALEIFGRLRIWDTENNSGVLIYVLLADRRVEIVADRGINRRVAPGEWQSICRTMESAFREGRFADGAVAGVEAVSVLLSRHFPRAGAANNELPDRPLVL